MHSTHWCPLCCPEELRFICSLLEYWLQLLVEALRHKTLNDSQDRKCRECQTTKNLWDESELSCGFSNSLQAFAALSSLLASNPSLGKDFDSSPYPRLRPAAWHAWGAWRDPITSRSNQVTVLPQAYTGIYKNKHLALIPDSNFPVAQNTFSFLIFSPLFSLKCECKKKKNEGSDGSHFSPLLYSLSPLVFLLSHFCLVPVCVCVSLSVCMFLPLWLNIKCGWDGCQSPFLSPKAPWLSSAGLVCTCILWYSASVQPANCLEQDCGTLAKLKGIAAYFSSESQ